MREHVNDVYVKRARSEGYRSRASYKLLELAQRDTLLRQGMTVVELGATPGGWSQVVRRKVHWPEVIRLKISTLRPLLLVPMVSAQATKPVTSWVWA